MPLYRCLGCAREFEAKAPTCADCGLDPAADRRHARCFAALETVHFDPPTHVPGFGKGHAACDPKKRVGPGGRFSGEHSAVTCPACRATPEFAAAAAGERPALPADTIRVNNLEEERRKAGV